MNRIKSNQYLNSHILIYFPHFQNGKTIDMNEVDHSDAVVVTDSHHSRLGDFWEHNGFKMFAIKGGLIKDAQQLIEKINASIFVLHLGGNDLEVLEGAVVSENMQ